MCASRVQTPSDLSIIFFKIDGVLFKRSDTVQFDIEQKAKELFPDETIRDCHCDIAATHLFDPVAVAKLDHLIKTVRNVSIVIDGNWGLNITVDELKKRLALYNFSNFIIDKADGMGKEFNDYQEKNRLPSTAARIAFWLETHPHIKNFVIFHGYSDASLKDGGLKEKFPNNFVRVDPQKLLTQDDVRRGLRILGKTSHFSKV